MKKLLAILAFVMVSCNAARPAEIRSADNPMEGSEEAFGTMKREAWEKALKVAKATDKEKAEWLMPVTHVVLGPRYVPENNGLPNRLCGETGPYLEADDQGMKVSATVAVYIRPAETKLASEILVHEYLHVCWWHRAYADPVWHAANPDSEEWVRAHWPAICPPL